MFLMVSLCAVLFTIRCGSPGCPGGVYGGVFLCCPFSNEMFWMKSWTELGQFLRVFLSTPTKVKVVQK